MASLISPSTLSITANNAASKPSFSTSSSFCPLLTNSKSKVPNVGKPSLYYASRISCKATKGSSNTNEPAEDKESLNNNLAIMFDRRNILLGLGGLYGAATTLTNNDPLLSLAAPIEPPDLSKCGPADLPSGAKPVNCCPPVTSNIIDFTFPVNPKIRVRPAAHLVTDKYLKTYKEAIKRMKALPSDDPRNFTQQANIHCAYCDGAYHQVGFPDLDLQVHNSWLFFPFHRWYLYFYERILASLVKDLDPNFAIPFWNWDTSNGIPTIYSDPKSPLYDSLRNPNHQPPTLVNLSFNGNEENLTPELQKEANHNTMYVHMVSTSNGSDLFFGSAYRKGEKSEPGGGSIEGVPHGTVHLWAGDNTQPNFEDMGNFYSAARDPIFYSHHANIDRLWTIWKTLGGKRKEPTDTDWLDASFLFYDENKNLVRVKVRDSVDTKKLGYDYQQVPTPWTTKPKSRQAGKTSTTQKTVTKQSAGVEAAIAAEIDNKETKFPLLLDSNVKVVVKRPKKGRSKEEKEEEEEVLVVEGIEYEGDIAVKFDVYINDEDDVIGGPTKTEFAGSFVNVPHKHKHLEGKTKTKTNLRLGITEFLEDLGAEDDESIVVTLVPKFGKGHVTIGGIKIVFHK